MRHVAAEYTEQAELPCVGGCRDIDIHAADLVLLSFHIAIGSIFFQVQAQKHSTERMAISYGNPLHTLPVNHLVQVYVSGKGHNLVIIRVGTRIHVVCQLSQLTGTADENGVSHCSRTLGDRFPILIPCMTCEVCRCLTVSIGVYWE